MLIKYTSNSANLDSSESTNLDEHENRNANTGQARARVYVIGTVSYTHLRAQETL